MNFTEVENMPGVTLRKFCGIPVEQVDDSTYNMCINEAQGEIIAETEDGHQIPIPVCGPCLDNLMKQYEVEELDNSGAVLLD